MKRAGGQSKQENDEEQGRSRARRLTPAETAYEDELARLRMRRDEFGRATLRLVDKQRSHAHSYYGQLATLPHDVFMNYSRKQQGLRDNVARATEEYEQAKYDYNRLNSKNGRMFFMDAHNERNAVDLTKDDEDEPDQDMDEGSGSGTSGVPAVGGFTPYANAQLMPLYARIG